jgi:hypothetical protein
VLIKFLIVFKMVSWSASKRPWTWDTTQGAYCRTDGTGMVLWDTTKHRVPENGYGLYLCKSDAEKCNRLIEMISDSSPGTLGRSLSLLICPTSWILDPLDVENVYPSMIGTILRKFGVRGMRCIDQSGNQIVAPIYYQAWKDHIVSAFPEEIRDAILGNPSLLRCVESLIAQCHANPRILNKFYQQVAAVAAAAAAESN